MYCRYISLSFLTASSVCEAPRCHFFLVLSTFYNLKLLLFNLFFLSSILKLICTFRCFFLFHDIFYFQKIPSEGLVWRWFCRNYWRVCLHIWIVLEWPWNALWSTTKIFCSRVCNLDHATFCPSISPTFLSFLFFIVSQPHTSG